MELEKIGAFGKKYLPSKKFVWLIGGVAVTVFALILVSNYVGYHRLFNAKPPLSAEGTLGEVVGRDSNNNGIPDWQETLYGLDPNGDGPANKKIIDDKRAAANITPADDSTNTTATDAFSQQLLSTIIALQQSGTLSPQAITQVASSLGDNVDAKHTPVSVYSMKDLTISKKDPAAAADAYYSAMQAVVAQYDSVDLGSEESIFADGFADGGQASLAQLAPIAAAYTSMSKQMIKIPVPPTIAQNALDLANATARMGASLVLVQNIYTDVLSGMVGVDDYTKASALSDAATQTISQYYGVEQ